MGSSWAGTHYIPYFYCPLGSKRRDFWPSAPPISLQRKYQRMLPEPSHSHRREDSHQQSQQPRTELNSRLHSDCDFRFTFGCRQCLWMPSHAGKGRVLLARLHPRGLQPQHWRRAPLWASDLRGNARIRANIPLENPNQSLSPCLSEQAEAHRKLESQLAV